MSVRARLRIEVWMRVVQIRVFAGVCVRELKRKGSYCKDFETISGECLAPEEFIRRFLEIVGDEMKTSTGSPGTHLNPSNFFCCSGPIEPYLPFLLMTVSSSILGKLKAPGSGI